MPSVFLTGVTGFVGGSILSKLANTHHDIEIKALVRKPDDAEKLRSVFPERLEIVEGTLSDLTLLTDTAATVDFVIHAAHDNIPALHAMIDGLALASSSSPGAKPPARLISITGPRSLIDMSIVPSGAADALHTPWSDITDAEEILSLPKSRIHAESDQAVIMHAIAKDVGVVLLSPGQLVGQGTGHFKKEGALAAYYAAVKSRGRAFVIGDGSAAWSWVSIADFVDAVMLLVEKAISEDESTRQQVGVSAEGYHFVRSGELTLRQRAEAVSERLDLGELENISIDQTLAIHKFGPVMWAADVRFRADKLAELGWKPQDLDWQRLMMEGRGERA